MSFKTRRTKKGKIGKGMDELKHQPEYQWYKGKFIPSKDVPIKKS
jgi:hypothetical protein